MPTAGCPALGGEVAQGVGRDRRRHALLGFARAVPRQVRFQAREILVERDGLRVRLDARRDERGIPQRLLRRYEARPEHTFLKHVHLNGAEVVRGLLRAKAQR